MGSKFYFFILALVIFSCKPYQEVGIRKGQITYEQYRSQQRVFPTKEGIIKFIDKGEGPVIVLLHGAPTSGWMYRKMIDPLVKGGYRVIVPDMLGFGSSASPEGYKIYDEENQAKRLPDLMDFLGVEFWSQVVHQMGGVWTWELMRQAPGKIEELVVLNTLIYEEGFFPPLRMTPGPVARTKMWSYKSGIGTNKLLKDLFSEGLKENTLNEVDIEGYRTPLTEGKIDGLYHYYTRTCNYFPDYSLIFENLDIPVAVMWGVHDTYLQWPPQESKVTQGLKVDPADIHLIDEKYFLTETKATEIAFKILRFLE